SLPKRLTSQPRKWTSTRRCCATRFSTAPQQVGARRVRADPREGSARSLSGAIPRSFAAVAAGSEYTQGKRMLYILGAIERTGEKSAAVQGSYYEGPLSASGNTYYLLSQEKGCKVVKTIAPSSA